VSNSEDDELRLNRLSAYRYRKTSSRLALEVHSHCEVPAGCGGVVLRWRAADEPVGVSFSFWTNAAQKPVVTVDGEPLGEQRTVVDPGAHVVALQVSLDGDASHAAVDVASFRVLGRAHLDPDIGSALSTNARSAADGRWRMTTSPPPAGWQRLTFVDDAWAVLVPRAAPTPGQNDWSLRYMTERATCLGAPDTLASLGGRTAWMRWHFNVGAGGFS
jgi:hypothetical protein